MRVFFLGSVLALILQSPGCIVVDVGDGGGPGGSPPGGSPGGPPPGNGDATLTVDNASNYRIDELYITPIDASTWGYDQLGGDVLRPGYSVTIDDIECDVYDVMVVDRLGRECILEGESLCYEDAYWVITNSVLAQCDDFGVSTLRVENASSYRFDELYLAAVDDPFWGPDLFGSDVLYPGEGFTVYDVTCDVYDVMVVDEFGYECILESLDLCFDDAIWIVTNAVLGLCDQFGSV